MQMYFYNQLKHKAYNETVEDAYDLAIHADGIFPRRMIEERRPSESLQVKKYRQCIWIPVTKPTWSKVLTELTKIRRSADWSIKYDDNAVPPKINENETLKMYCEDNYPYFRSLTNWAFSSLLPLYAKDANAVVAVLPIELPMDSSQYVRPYAYQFDSCNVYDFKQDDYCVIRSTDKIIFVDPEGRKYFGNVFYFITTMWVEKWTQISVGGSYGLTWHYDHNIGKLPAFRVQSLVKKTLDDTIVFKSRLAAMQPRLDEAIREYSDMQAEVVQHIYSERWELTDDCPKCKGKGHIKPAGFAQKEIDCDVCEGTGAKPRNPYTVMKVKMPMGGEQLPPMPPAGIINKNTDIVKIQDERIDKHEFKALSAINMEYLANTPLTQSGTAKEVDRDPASTFCNAVAEDIVFAMDKVYEYTSDYRYIMQIPDAVDRKALCPVVNVPDKFDLLSSSYLEDQIAKQKENKGNPIIIAAMEKEYVNKKFNGDALLRQKVILTIELDPLAGLAEDDKMTRLSNKGITLETYIISSNINEFVDRATDEKGETFYGMSCADQKALLKTYADEQVQDESAKATVLDLVPGEGATQSTDPTQPNYVEPGKQNKPGMPAGTPAAA